MRQLSLLFRMLMVKILPNTLTFNVTAVEDEATGSVTFTTDATANAVEEGATVTANASGLTDQADLSQARHFSGLLRMIHKDKRCGY